MTENTPTAEPTAASLKKELSDSLEILKQDFAGLVHFVTEFVADGNSARVSLTKDDLDDLLSATQEIQDAASDIEFEANKIRETLNRIII